MPHLSLTVETAIRPSFRVQQLVGLFDLPPAAHSRETFTAEVPHLDEAWTIGAIVGPSGSGKSTLARAAFGDAVLKPAAWAADAAVIDGFPAGSIGEVTQALAAVGFNSPPAWLRPFQVLSNGEQFRCELARALLSDEPLVVCDEFTSVVDRTVAQIGSAALAKAVRRANGARRFVAVTCHYDVLPWLEPDWVLDLASGQLSRRRLRRPAIELFVRPCPQAAWRRFARHHYLSGSLSRGATCHVALWRAEPVAFCAVIGLLGHAGHKRVTRLVTLPDYQGLGIGTRLLEFIATQVRRRGERISITTRHPAMCAYLQRSPRWRRTGTRKSGKPSRQVMRAAQVRDSRGRGVVSFEFLG
jgi:GNAT superfamily N-acetyltransferase